MTRQTPSSSSPTFPLSSHEFLSSSSRSNVSSIIPSSQHPTDSIRANIVTRTARLPFTHALFCYVTLLTCLCNASVFFNFALYNVLHTLSPHSAQARRTSVDRQPHTHTHMCLQPHPNPHPNCLRVSREGDDVEGMGSSENPLLSIPERVKHISFTLWMERSRNPLLDRPGSVDNHVPLHALDGKK